MFSQMYVLWMRISVCVCCCFCSLCYDSEHVRCTKVHITHGCLINSMSQIKHKSGGARDWFSVAVVVVLVVADSYTKCLLLILPQSVLVFHSSSFFLKHLYWHFLRKSIWISNKMESYLIFKWSHLYRSADHRIIVYRNFAIHSRAQSH